MTQDDVMRSLRPEAGRIVVPRRHGEVLVEPGLPEMAAFLLRGRTESDLRVKAREQFLLAVREWAATIGADSHSATDGPWVFTGHQVEFYHAGVWAKVVAADELAKRVGGAAFDLLVDHDTVDQCGFDVPVMEEGKWEREAVDWGVASVVPADGLKGPTREMFEEWDGRVAAHEMTGTDSMAAFMTELGKVGGAYGVWMSRARKRFEESMGLNVWHVPTSLVCRGEAWEGFVRSWVENAEAWVGVYNKHLGAYRKKQGIKNSQQPMPDLGRKEGEVELPFWIYRKGEARKRLVLRGGKMVIGDLVCTVEECFAGFEVRPRALTLTMFVRMYLADVFIHGIGGALYDQITDGIMGELFGVALPYCCVSAAWLLPLGKAVEDQGDLSGLMWRRNHLKHNPQQGIDAFTAVKTEVAEMVRDRGELVERIAGSLVADRRGEIAKLERRGWFEELHGVNARLHGVVPGVLGKLDREISALREGMERNKVLLWREWFFGLHTRGSLGELVSKLRKS